MMQEQRRKILIGSAGLLSVAALRPVLAQPRKLRFGVGPLLPNPEDTKKAYTPIFAHLASQLGADFVIAVDISSKASGKAPTDMLGIVNQSISIMGQRLGEQELARADIVIRPKVLDIGAADFSQRGTAILEGEKAAMAAMPQIRAKIQQLQRARAAAAAPAPVAAPKCEEASRLGKLMGRKDKC